MLDRVVAIDLGGTNLRAAVVATDGAISHHRSIPTDSEQGPENIVGRLVGLIDEVATAAGLGPDAPTGVAVPGPLDPHRGIVYFMPNLKGWRDFPLGDALRSRTARPIRLGNDGNCAALGEARFGAGVGVDDLIYFALGTGVGGGIISGGRLIDGPHGLSGEVGHVVVALDGPRCHCGSIGCLEAYVAGWAISRDAELVATTTDGERLRLVAAGDPLNATLVAAAAAAGDPAALAILERAGRALGAAIGALVNLFNPALVVVGGGVGTIGEALLAPARRGLADHSFPTARARMDLVSSVLGDDTALLGAAALAFDRASPRS